MRNTSGLRRGGRGRQKGVPNKVTSEIRQLAQRLFDDAYWADLKRQLDRGKVAPVLQMRLLEYAYGAPTQTLEIPGFVDVAELLAKKVIHELHPGPTRGAS